MRFEYRIQDGQPHFVVNGEDRTRELFTAALTEQLKPVVNNPTVREALVNKMRDAARAVLDQGVPGVVMEGRDIGTVVFPSAVLKFYIHADLEERTRRRAAELQARGEPWTWKACANRFATAMIPTARAPSGLWCKPLTPLMWTPRTWTRRPRCGGCWKKPARVDWRDFGFWNQRQMNTDEHR